MKRFALVIEASEVPGEDRLPGAVADAKNYRTWLTSKPGGAWYDREIVTLHTPTAAEVRRAITQAGRVDYAFVAFSGHGFHSREHDLTKVCLRDGQLTVRDLLPDSSRSTAVVDACRNVMPEIFDEAYAVSYRERELYAKAAEVRNHRQEFEDFVSAAETGPVFLYSCDLNEAAGESARGGYFSRYLVEAGKDYADQNPYSRSGFLMRAAFDTAAQNTSSRNRAQNPVFEPGRRRVHFPFAV